MNNIFKLSNYTDFHAHKIQLTQQWSLMTMQNKNKVSTRWYNMAYNWWKDQITWSIFRLCTRFGDSNWPSRSCNLTSLDFSWVYSHFFNLCSTAFALILFSNYFVAFLKWALKVSFSSVFSRFFFLIYSHLLYRQ